MGECVKAHAQGSQPDLPTKVTTYIKQVAQTSGVVCGKWMVFEGRASRRSIAFEDQWNRVKQAVNRNLLGRVAKMKAGEPGHRVLCIYTKSFTDDWDAFRVLEQLHSMSIFPVYWEAEMVTLLGMDNNRNKCVPRLDLAWFHPSLLPCSYRLLARELGKPSDYQCRTTTRGNINYHRHTI